MKELNDLLNKSKEKSEQSELFYMKSFKDRLKFEGNELQSMRTAQSEGIGLRLRKKGKTGFASSTEINEDIIEKALAGSEFGNDTDFPFASGKLNFSPEGYRDKEIEDLRIESLIERGEHIIKEIRNFDKRINVNVTFEKILEEIRLISSSGFEGSYKKDKFWMLVKTELTREKDIFEIWNGQSWMPDREREEKIIEETLFYIKKGMDIAKMESGRYPVLFYPEALEELMTGFITGINGDKIYRKTSPLHNKLGEQIFNEKFTIYDDGTYPGGINSIPFDDEGKKAQKTVLVEKGILKNFLLDLKNAKKLNMLPGGNGFRDNWTGERSYKYYPGIKSTTITMNEGIIPKEDMIKDIKTGVLLKSAPDFTMGNIQNGDFSGTVYHGYKIEKGKITGRLKNTVITGNLYKLFKDCPLEISREKDRTVSFNSVLPYILFKDMEVTA